MKPIYKILVITTLLFVSNASWAVSKSENKINRMDAQQAEIDSLKKAIEEIKGTKKEKLAPPPGSEEVKSIPLSSTVPLRLYGFISAEAMYSDSQLSSFGTNDNTPASYNKNMVAFNRVVDESVEQNNDAFISFTVQNSQIGLVLDPYDFGGKNFSVDSRLELDFQGVTNMNIATVVPRIRRAYASIGQKSWRILFGQEWDVFSPLNPASLNLGGALWRQGNLGYRRPQIRFTYEHAWEDKKGLEFVFSVNLPSNSMSFSDSGNATGIPMGEARVGFWHKLPAGKLKAYISAAYAKHNNAVVGADRINNWALAASAEVPVHKFFTPAAEFHYGYSMGMMLSNTNDDTRQRFLAGWGQIRSFWLDWFESNIGYGIESVESAQVATGWVKSNQVAFANIKFKPVKAFVIGFEYNYLRTNYQGSGASNANAGFTNVLFYF